MEHTGIILICQQFYSLPSQELLQKNIGGTTFHSGLSFKFGSDVFDFSSETLNQSRNNLENVVIVHEFFVSKELFGGRSVFLVVDIMQLGQIKAASIYSQPKCFDSSIMFDCKELNLWDNCKSVLLETKIRQGEPGHKC